MSPGRAAGSEEDALVVFGTSRGEGVFSMICRPRTKAAERSGAWIDRCNALGRGAVDAAAADGWIAPVEGPAFGMASEFMRQVPPGVTSSQTLSRDIPLIARDP